MKQVIYCISGLGADDKIFINLHLNGYILKHVPWLRPDKKESIDEYANRMARQIKDPFPVVLGVSFGGMIGIEIARLMPLRKLIIVSSIKSTHELPRWMKIAGTLYLNRLVPIRSFKVTEKIDNDRLGVSNEAERDMVREYRRKADPVYLEWAVDQVLNWRNEWMPEGIVHIHGDKDKIFPLKKVTANHIIKDGTHMMIFNRAEDISDIITRELKQLPE